MRAEQLFAEATLHAKKLGLEIQAKTDELVVILGDEYGDYIALTKNLRDVKGSIYSVGLLKKNKRMTRESLVNCMVKDFSMIGLTRDQVWSKLKELENSYTRKRLEIYRKYPKVLPLSQDIERLIHEQQYRKINSNSHYGMLGRSQPEAFRKRPEHRTADDFDKMQAWMTVNSNMLYGSMGGHRPQILTAMERENHEQYDSIIGGLLEHEPDSVHRVSGSGTPGDFLVSRLDGHVPEHLEARVMKNRTTRGGFAFHHVNWHDAMETKPVSVKEFEDKIFEDAKKAMSDPDTVVIVIDSIPQQGEK